MTREWTPSSSCLAGHPGGWGGDQQARLHSSRLGLPSGRMGLMLSTSMSQRGGARPRVGAQCHGCHTMGPGRALARFCICVCARHGVRHLILITLLDGTKSCAIPVYNRADWAQRGHCPRLLGSRRVELGSTSEPWLPSSPCVALPVRQGEELAEVGSSLAPDAPGHLAQGVSSPRAPVSPDVRHKMCVSHACVSDSWGRVWLSVWEASGGRGTAAPSAGEGGKQRTEKKTL